VACVEVSTIKKATGVSTPVADICKSQTLPVNRRTPRRQFPTAGRNCIAHPEHVGTCLKHETPV